MKKTIKTDATRAAGTMLGLVLTTCFSVLVIALTAKAVVSLFT